MPDHDEKTPAEQYDDRRSEVCVKFGALIRRLRLDRNLTQEELTERSELGADTLSQLERGKFSPTLHTMRKLAMGLGMSLSAIFDELEGS